MKTSDKKDLQTKTLQELKKLLKEGHDNLLSLQLDLKQGKLKNTKSFLLKRKERAIIKTMIREKEENNG